MEPRELGQSTAKISRAHWLALALCCIWVLSACSVPFVKPSPPPVATKSTDVANIYVNAYPVVPWSSVSAALAPGRNWKISDAQNAALTQTAAQTNQVASILSSALALNFSSNPGTTSTGTPSVPNAPGQLTTTLAALAGLAGLGSADGSEQLVAVTGLYQQAAIIDAQIANQYLPRGYVPYLLTYQINIQPTRRDWAYDLYVDIALMPGKGILADDNNPNRAKPPIIVKPIVITDAIETSSVQRNTQQITQALAQLSASLGKGGIFAQSGSAQNISLASAGYDKNSVITAGLVNQSMLRVRLGAELAGTNNYALFPRTYNVSSLVLVRAGDEKDPGIDEMVAMTLANFYPIASDASPKVGAPVALDNRRDRKAMATRVANSLAQYHYPYLAPYCIRDGVAPDEGTKAFDVTKDEDLDTYLDFLSAVDQGNYPAVRTCLGLNDSRRTDSFVEQNTFRYMLLDVQEVQVDERRSTINIPLNGSGAPVLPDTSQYVLVSDNSDGTQQTFQFIGGQNLRTDQLQIRASFDVDKGPGPYLLPTSVSLGAANNQQVINATFPGPSSLGLPANTKISLIEVALLDSGQWPQSAACNSSKYKCYKHLVKVNAPSGPVIKSGIVANCSNLLTTTSGSLQSVNTGTTGVVATAYFSVGDLSGYSVPCAVNGVAKQFKSPFALVVAGAAAIGVPPSSTGACLGQSNDKVLIASTGKCAASLQLTNIDSTGPVTATVQDSAGTPLPGSLTWKITAPAATKGH